jgi:general secretion pathway protein D
VLLITPQLVRGVERTDASLSEFWSGTEAQMRTRSPFVETVGDSAGVATSGASGALGVPGATSAMGTASSPGATAAPGAAGSTRTAGKAVMEATGTAAASTPSNSAARATTLTLDATSTTAPPMTLSWLTPDAAKAGEVFVVALQARSDAALKGATLQLRYDTTQIEVLGVDDGGYFDSVGGRAVFTPRVDPTQGAIYATLGGTGTASRAGEGAFVKLRLRALKPASRSSLQLTQSVAVDAANRRVPIEGAQMLELRSAP